MTVLPDGSKLYVANRLSGCCDGSVSVLDTVTQQITAEIPLTVRGPLTADPTGASVYAASAGGISAQVVVMEPTGMDTFIACRHEGVDFSAVFRERHDFAPGTTIRLQPDLQRAHLFDAATGQRLAA